MLALSVLFLIGCDTYDVSEEQSIPEQTPIESEIEQIQTQVVATVNGEEILSDEIFMIQQNFMMQGIDISSDEALEEVIHQRILYQHVAEMNMSVSDEDAEAEIEFLLSQQGMTLDDYRQQLEMQGISYAGELENFKRQIALQIYLEALFFERGIEVTEEDAREFYESYAQSVADAPSYEELEAQIFMVLEQEKQQEILNELVQTLRVEAEVEYN